MNNITKYILLAVIVSIAPVCDKNSTSPDNTLPNIVLEYLPEYTFQTVHGTILITAVATDNESVDRVEFYAIEDNVHTLISIDEQYPFELQWDTTLMNDCSTYLLYAIVFDSSENQKQSALHSFNIDNSQDGDIAVHVWLTEGAGDARLEPQPDRYFGQNCINATEVAILSDLVYQEIDGFGAALTQSSAWLINNSPNRDLIIEKLFSPTNGIGISYIRLAMGSSDFVHGPHYSYDDTPGDTDLSEFNLDIDEEDIIPVLQDILLINPDLKIVASPWSAPGWMKTSGSMIGGELMVMHYPTYAQYFVRFLQEYQTRGIDVEAITIQNEPGYVPSNYPGMYMSSSMQANFIRDHLGPALAANGLNTKIQVFDHNWGWDPDFTSGADFVLDIYNDSEAAQYVDGSAWHGYGGDSYAQTIVHNAFPEKAVYFTERTNSLLWEDWDGVLAHMGKYYFIDVLNNWSKNVLLWNLALDTNNGPYNGGCDNCTGVVTVEDSYLNYEIDYYLIGHFSKFIPSGAHRIGTADSDSELETIAFSNPDGSFTAIVLNTSYTAKNFSIVWDDMSFFYSLSGQGMATFTWNP